MSFFAIIQRISFLTSFASSDKTIPTATAILSMVNSGTSGGLMGCGDRSILRPMEGQVFRDPLSLGFIALGEKELKEHFELEPSSTFLPGETRMRTRPKGPVVLKAGDGSSFARKETWKKRKIQCPGWTWCFFGSFPVSGWSPQISNRKLGNLGHGPVLHRELGSQASPIHIQWQ